MFGTTEETTEQIEQKTQEAPKVVCTNCNDSGMACVECHAGDLVD